MDKSNNLPGPRAKSIKLENCTIEVFLWEGSKKDKAEYDVHLAVSDIKKGTHLTLSDLKLELTPYVENGASPTASFDYVLQKITIYKQADTSIHHNVETITDSTIRKARTIALSGGYSYSLAYYFIDTNKKKHYRKMQVTLTGTLGSEGKSESINQPIGFKRYYYIDIAGN